MPFTFERGTIDGIVVIKPKLFDDERGFFMEVYAAKEFRNAVSSIDSIHYALDFAFSFQAFGVSIKPIQVKYEIAKLIEIVAGLRPRVVLEIGTVGGGTLFLFTRAADPDAKIISMDLPGGPFGGGYPRWKIPPIQILLQRR
jgi:hypothetical protein